ncbi:MAG TPA: AAA family ATPase, partial [Candidatus Limnocylindrales bacterium]
MKVVSVVNYKGGVGKTTLTANLGAGLAARGNRVLLIDLDPQASLTYSFFTPHEFKERLASERTIKKWYDSPSRGRAVTKLADLIVTPDRVNRQINHGGRLDMILSHEDLVTVDTLLADAIDKRTREVPLSRYVKVFRRLKEGLSHTAFSGYDFVLVDCPPNLNMMTKNAVVASDFMVIPCRPDYLSTNGIDHLGSAIHGFIRTFNHQAQIFHQPREAVVFTMVTYKTGSPIDAQGLAIHRVG